MKIRKFLIQIKAICQWVYDGKFFILSIIVVSITILYLMGIFSLYTKVISAFFSVLGLLIILFLQFLDTKRFSFQNPRTITEWVKSLPILKPKIIYMDAGIQMQDIRMKDYASVSPADSATLEEKVDFLLRNHKQIQTYLNSLDDRIDNIKDSLKNKSKEFEDSLDKLDSSMKSIIAGHVVGDYDVNLFGIITVICGTIMQIFCM